MQAPDWSASTGDVWARRWRDTDRALAAVGAALDAAIIEAAPAGPFRALDIGSGPGSTALALAARRPDADIIGCDLSAALVELAQSRARGMTGVRFVAEDAAKAAREHGPFDLFLSRHGVMFFDDPAHAFRTFRRAASPGARLVFSCFRAWESNPWAAELASAAAGRPVPPPGREPSGFAFAEPDYVRDLLTGAGWGALDAHALDFDYRAGEGEEAVAQALDFLLELGPAARAMEGFEGKERQAAQEQVRAVVERHFDGRAVIFPGAAWIWKAQAGKTG